jgi:CRISPR/Cas system-associated exonuclease Cas4 (RecB family)
MQRNDLETVVHEVAYDPDMWLDIEVRARRHHQNVQAETVPPATPLTEWECKYCSYKSECLKEGGSPEWL